MSGTVIDLAADVARTLARTRLREATAEGAFDLALLADKRNYRPVDAVIAGQPSIGLSCPTRL